MNPECGWSSWSESKEESQLEILENSFDFVVVHTFATEVDSISITFRKRSTHPDQQKRRFPVLYYFKEGMNVSLAKKYSRIKNG